jgi:CheY-like chemotaxis protein
MNVCVAGNRWSRSDTNFTRSGETEQIPILAVTALYQASDRQACIDAGCNDYIIKPFTFDELISKIKARRQLWLASKGGWLELVEAKF